jgi:hypothetical protein
VALSRKVTHFEPLKKQSMGAIQTNLAVRGHLGIWMRQSSAWSDLKA